MKVSDDHVFGGNWTYIKLEMLRRYLTAFNIALQDKPSSSSRFSRIYIDAFAGTGKCSISLGGNVVDVDGSAKIAIDVLPAFDSIYFIDNKPRHVQALGGLISGCGERDINILGGDCNDSIKGILDEINWRSSRGVIFLDPYGMSVKWETLVSIADTRALDLWYLFPISAVCRQAARSFEKVDESKSSALTRLFGDDHWKEDLYRESAQGDFFLFESEPGRRERYMEQAHIQAYMKKRLERIFPVVLDPVQLPVSGSPLFSLFFISSNPTQRSMALSRRIASHLLNMGGTLKEVKRKGGGRANGGPSLF